MKSTEFLTHMRNFQRYEAILEKILLDHVHSKYIVIGTYQNFDYMKVDVHSFTSQLLDIFMTNGLAPCITRPTRLTNTSATLIDNIDISAEYCNSCSSGIMISDISDHFPFNCWCWK